MPLRRCAILFISTALFTSACQISLAGDILPPAGSELGQTTATPETLAFPAAMPDAQIGADIYAQSCAPCHGERGLGDGDQSGALPVAVPAIGDPDLAQASSPEVWYLQVSQGNLDNYMPPFAGSLSVQERWDVLAHVYSLSRDQDQLLAGQQLVAALGLDASDLESIAAQSQAELGATLSTDLDLATEEGLALAGYLQASALGWAPAAGVAELEVEEEPEVIDEASREAADEEAEVADAIILQGAVSNGSGGGIPVGAEVLLRGFDQTSEVFSSSTELDSEGRYRFEQIELDPDLVYAATIEYAGLIYFSEAVQLGGEQTEYELALTIYEITHDSSSLLIDRLQLVFQFGDEGRIRLIQLVSISNTGTEAVAPLSDTEPVLRYNLPPEASNLAFESGAIGDRYVPIEDGFGDLRAVLPGSGGYQMLYAYELPYDSRLDYSQLLYLPASIVNIYAPAGQIEVHSADFSIIGDQEFDGEVFTGHRSMVEYAANEVVSFELRGAHPSGGGNWLVELASQSELLFGLVALASAVAAIWLWLRHQAVPGPNPEEIMDAIIALDARYAEATIAEDAYLKRRAALKERLRQALDRRP